MGLEEEEEEEERWFCFTAARVKKVVVLVQPCQPTHLLGPYTDLAHHLDSSMPNFWNSSSAIIVSPSVWASTGLMQARIMEVQGTGHLGMWWQRSDSVGNIPFLGGCAEEVVLIAHLWAASALSPSVIPCLRVSKAGKQQDLTKNSISHFKFWEKLKETFLCNNCVN